MCASHHVLTKPFMETIVEKSESEELMIGAKPSPLFEDAFRSTLERT